MKKTSGPGRGRKVARNSREHVSSALKSAREAVRVLPMYEKLHPDDDRPRLAINAIREWALGKRMLGMVDVRKLSLDAHAAARAAKTDAARFAARAAGQAVAVWHAPGHALAVPYYVRKAVIADRTPMSKYLALLRGINVGGKNLIKMTDLKACFESLGFSDVMTYIQSGNVIFSAKTAGGGKLEKKIERGLSDRFKYAARVVVLSGDELREVVRSAPNVFGEKPDKFRCDVIFLKKPLTAAAAMKSVSVRPGVDVAHAGKHALYFSRLSARAAQSYLPKVIKTTAYAHMTIRNWNTVTKLLALVDADGGFTAAPKKSKKHGS